MVALQDHDWTLLAETVECGFPFELTHFESYWVDYSPENTPKGHTK